ncbi:MAG: hypothetical protein ACUVWR_03470 [Anaerolineae bacterium]
MARMTALLGMWAVVAPFVFSWDVGVAVLAGNILPGLQVAACGGYAGLRLTEAASVPGQYLFVSLTSAMTVLGAWMLVCPLLLGLRLESSTYLGAVFPGAAILVLSLANGYYGWREARE